MAMTCKHCFIDGRVQGVFYRSSAYSKAIEIGVTGWVKNLDDGRVEAMIQGNPDQVNAMYDWLWEGPMMADVTSVQCTDCQPGEYTSFSVSR